MLFECFLFCSYIHGRKQIEIHNFMTLHSTLFHYPPTSQECNALDIPTQLPDIVAQSVLLAVCILLLVASHNEKIFKEKPYLTYVFSIIMAVSMEVCEAKRRLTF